MTGNPDRPTASALSSLRQHNEAPLLRRVAQLEARVAELEALLAARPTAAPKNPGPEDFAALAELCGADWAGVDPEQYVAEIRRDANPQRVEELERCLHDCVPFIGYDAHVPELVERAEKLCGYPNPQHKERHAQ